jgi:hypothetical protein
MSVIKVTTAAFADDISRSYFADTISFAGLTSAPAWGYFPDGRSWFAIAGTPESQLGAADIFGATNLILSGFNDTLALQGNSPVRAINGGPGEDKISSSPDGPGVTIEGGNNNDVLSGLSPERDHLIGQNDNDTLIMDGMDQGSGGAGADRFVLTQLAGGSAFISDLQAAPGKNHDVVDLWQPLHDAGYDFTSFTAAISAGVLGVHYSHGYTYLSYDTDGDHVADHEFAHIKGVVTPDLFDSTFKVSYLDSYSHSILAGDDVLDGTKNPGRDHLFGLTGNDTLLMDGSDHGIGGPGADRFVIASPQQFSSAFIGDLNPAEHDVVDMWKPLHDYGYAFDSFSQAQQAGVLSVIYDHGYTYVNFDTDGDHFAESQLVHIKAIVLPADIDQTFLVSYEDSYYHQAGIV